MKEISCGVIIQNSNNQILGCIPYGKPDKRDLPKGRIEEDEDFISTAVREVYEETGLDLNPNNLKEIGLLSYTSKKDLFLYHYFIDDIEITSLSCISLFENKKGELVPEMIGYELINIPEFDKFYPGLIKILNTYYGN